MFLFLKVCVLSLYRVTMSADQTDRTEYTQELQNKTAGRSALSLCCIWKLAVKFLQKQKHIVSCAQQEQHMVTEWTNQDRGPEK